jgi:hypothetical protein
MNSEQPRRTPSFLWALALAIMLCCYPLSLGPIAWLYERNLIPERIEPALETCYQPLDWMYTSGPPFVRTACDWYLNVWLRSPA